MMIIMIVYNDDDDDDDDENDNDDHEYCMCKGNYCDGAVFSLYFLCYWSTWYING